MKHLFCCFAFFFFLMDWLPAARAQDRTATGLVLDGTNQ